MNWWLPKEIIFSQVQILWLMENLPVISQGEWPPCPYETGYTDSTKVMVSPSRHAHFERPCQISAEITYRLSRTGTDGKLLIRQVQHDELMLEPESKSALAYITGWKRKRMRYIDWKRFRRQREKGVR